MAKCTYELDDKNFVGEHDLSWVTFVVYNDMTDENVFSVGAEDELNIMDFDIKTDDFDDSEKFLKRGDKYISEVKLRKDAEILPDFRYYDPEGDEITITEAKRLFLDAGGRPDKFAYLLRQIKKAAVKELVAGYSKWIEKNVDADDLE